MTFLLASTDWMRHLRPANISSDLSVTGHRGVVAVANWNNAPPTSGWNAPASRPSPRTPVSPPATAQPVRRLAGRPAQRPDQPHPKRRPPTSSGGQNATDCGRNLFTEHIRRVSSGLPSGKQRALNRRSVRAGRDETDLAENRSNDRPESDGVTAAPRLECAPAAVPTGTALLAQPPAGRVGEHVGDGRGAPATVEES
jgi:hypothetical protein